MELNEREEELGVRIEREIAYHAGSMPVETAAAWSGYLAACIEWGLIRPDAHQRLMGRLPKLATNPAIDILLGRDDGSAR